MQLQSYASATRPHMESNNSSSNSSNVNHSSATQRHTLPVPTLVDGIGPNCAAVWKQFAARNKSGKHLSYVHEVMLNSQIYECVAIFWPTKYA